MLEGPTLPNEGAEVSRQTHQRLKPMAKEQKHLRKRQEEHYVCFWSPEEVIKWCEVKCPSGKLDKFHVDKIHAYYSNIDDLAELDEALDWFTEHLFDDYKVTLKYLLPSGQTLTARNYDMKETRRYNYAPKGQRSC